VQPYCKAFFLKDLMRRPGWKDDYYDAICSPAEAGRTELLKVAGEPIVFVRNDFVVTEGVASNETDRLARHRPAWKAFCSESLEVLVPDDIKNAKLRLASVPQGKAKAAPLKSLACGSLLYPMTNKQHGFVHMDRVLGIASPILYRQFRVQGLLYLGHIWYALETLLSRHSALRTTIVSKDGAYYQKIFDRNEADLSFVDASCCAAAPDQFVALLNKLNSDVPSILDEPLTQIRLVRLSETDHILAARFHHAIADDLAMRIVLRETLDCYSSSLRSRFDVAPPPGQFVDYAVMEDEYFNSAEYDVDLRYWKGRLVASPGKMRLLDVPEAEASGDSAVRFAEVPASTTDRIRAACLRNKITLYMFLLAILRLLIHQITGERDVLIDTTVDDREESEFGHVVGDFASHIVLRRFVDVQTNLRSFLQGEREQFLEDYEHRRVPTNIILEHIPVGRQVTFNFLSGDSEKGFVRTGLKVTPLSVAPAPSPLRRADAVDVTDLSFSFSLEANKTPKIQGFVRYTRNKLHPASASRMVNNYVNLLRAAAEPEMEMQPLSRLLEMSLGYVISNKPTR